MLRREPHAATPMATEPSGRQIDRGVPLEQTVNVALAEHHTTPHALRALADAVDQACGSQDEYRFSHKRRDGSIVRGGTGPAVRILSPSSKATDGVSCVTRREAGATGFDCGVGWGPLLPGVIPPSRWLRLYRTSLGFSLFLRAALHRGTEGSRVVTNTESDQEARSRSELARGRDGRRLSLAINARRHLSGLVKDGPGPNQNPALPGGLLQLTLPLPEGA